MGGIASWGGKAAGTSGAQRGRLQGLPLYLWGWARIFRGHGNAALGLQCQGNVSPKAKPFPFPFSRKGSHANVDGTKGKIVKSTPRRFSWDRVTVSSLNFVGRNFVPSEFKRFDLGKWDKARGYLASSCRRGSTPLWSGKSNETPCWPWLTISCFDAFRYRGLRLRTLLFLLAWNWLFQSSSSSHRELRFFIISLSFSDRIDDDFS